MRKYTGYIIVLLLVLMETANALPKDSVIYRDSIATALYIDDYPPFKIGIGGSYGLNFYHDGALPVVLNTSCDTFLRAKGNGINLLARIDLPIEEHLWLVPVLSYENLSGNHTWGEFGKSNDTSGGVSKIHTVEFDHVITAPTKALGAKALIHWEFAKQYLRQPYHYHAEKIPSSLSFYLEGGPAFFYLFDQNYTKVASAIRPGAVIITPSGPTRQYTEASGPLPNANSFLAALSLSFGAEFFLSQKLTASPNIEYLLPL
ncbi:MAG: hypothetical protein ACHQM6_09955, partial [Candidatus Kapaibacterium sp.]